MKAMCLFCSCYWQPRQPWVWPKCTSDMAFLSALPEATADTWGNLHEPKHSLGWGPMQHNVGTCLMTGLKTLFWETSGLTFERCLWNLPKGSMLTLATDFSLRTLENSPCFPPASNILLQSIMPSLTCYSAKRHTHLVDAHSFPFPCPSWECTSSF